MSDSLSTGKHFSASNKQDQSFLFAAEPSTPRSRKKRPSQVTEARAGAQRRKVDSQRAERAQRQAQEDAQPPASLPSRKPKQAVSCTWERDAYLQDHIGGNRSIKTIEWHRTVLTFFCSFLEEEHQITLVEEILSNETELLIDFRMSLIEAFKTLSTILRPASLPPRGTKARRRRERNA